MTTREKLEDMVYQNGVFESDAKKIVEAAELKLKELKPDYNFTMDRPSEEYPDVMYNVVYNLAVKPAAREYIEQNIPQAWFKTMFD